jgi:hypothetical protein
MQSKKEDIRKVVAHFIFTTSNFTFMLMFVLTDRDYAIKRSYRYERWKNVAEQRAKLK